MKTFARWIARYALMMTGVLLATLGATRIAYTRSGLVVTGPGWMNEPALVGGVGLLAAWVVLAWRWRGGRIGA